MGPEDLYPYPYTIGPIYTCMQLQESIILNPTYISNIMYRVIRRETWNDKVYCKVISWELASNRMLGEKLRNNF